MRSFLVYLSKVLLKLALDKSIKHLLPQVYRQLDAEVPLLIYNNASPSTIKSVVAHAISNVTGVDAPQSQIDAVIGLYDPIKAALHRIR